MRTQVIFIHGGETFNTYEEYLEYLQNCTVTKEKLNKKRYADTLQEKLGEGFEVLKPTMPSKYNSKYIEWKIWFDKLVLLIERDGVILVGGSLGAIFLAKYLSENKFPYKIKATILIAAPFDDKDAEYSLVDFALPADLSLLNTQGGKIIFYHSKDDPVVAFSDSTKYLSKLSSARLVTFEDRRHFSQPEFPELIEEIKRL